MNTTAILFPAIALAWWSIAILALVSYRRLEPSLNTGTRITERIEQYSVGEPHNIPALVSATNRNYVNLFESPVLFYFCCAMLYVTETVTVLTVWLAWTYFTLRIVHSVVHVTYNRVLHRGAIFALSVIVLCGLMGQLSLSLAAG